MRNYVSGMLLLPEDVAYMTRAANAFDEVLAVAKATDAGFRDHQTGERDSICEGSAGSFTISEMRIVDALAALDAAHPGWREWA